MRAASFGWKLRACIAWRIRVAVLGDTFAAPVMNRDTVAVETEAILATSRIPTRPPARRLYTRNPNLSMVHMNHSSTRRSENASDGGTRHQLRSTHALVIPKRHEEPVPAPRYPQQSRHPRETDQCA